MEPSNILKVEITRGLLKKGYQVLFMSKDDTGGARFQARRSGALGDSKRILESFNVLEAEHTRAVVAKTRHLKRLYVSKVVLHRGFTDAVNARELLKKGYQVLPKSKGGTGEAEFQGREVILMSNGDTGEAELQGREALYMSRDDTGWAKLQGQEVDMLGTYKAAQLGQARQPGGRLFTCFGQPAAGARDCW